jgi:cytosine/adenosine deaminase-related metal-dependent hydrolase
VSHRGEGAIVTDKPLGGSRRTRLLLKGGRILDYFPADLEAGPAPLVEDVDLRIADCRIVERGPDLEPHPNEEVLELEGATVLPGNINGHMHLYTALTAGAPSPPRPLSSFKEVLSEVYWALDRALDKDAVYLSAVAGAWDSVRSGTTLIFDMHSSMSAVRGSLDLVEQGVNEVGLRASLCYEVTDRAGKGLRDTALEETERYLEKLKGSTEACVAQFGGMVGANASFTLEPRTLELLAELAVRYDAPVHMHLAEGRTDREISKQRGWPDPVERLDGAGLMRPGSVFVHGVDLTPLELRVFDDRRAWLVHCGRSNMNNGVGRADLKRWPSHSALGTNGLDQNMWGELRTTFFRGNENKEPDLDHAGAARLFLGCYRLARASFREPFGSLRPGAPADFIVLDNFQKTPLTTDTWLNHLLFDFHPWDIGAVYVGGRLVYRNGDGPPVAPRDLQAAASRVWKTMGWS